MAKQKRKRRASDRWVYAYELDPPQPEPRFKRIRALLSRARAAARRSGSLWTGRIIVESSITHILVVTDDPGEVREIDRAIEKELHRLNMDFALNGPARFALPGTSATLLKRKPTRAEARARRSA